MIKKNKKFAIAAGFAVFLFLIIISIFIEWRYKQKSFFAEAEYNNTRIEFVMNRATQRAVEDNIASEEEVRNYLQSYNNIVLVQGSSSWVRNGSARRGTLTISISDPSNFNIALHEARHIALYAVGIPKEEHHRIMFEKNWCFEGVCNAH